MRKFIVSTYTCLFLFAGNASAAEPEFVTVMEKTRSDFATYQQTKNAVTYNNVVRGVNKTTELMVTEIDTLNFTRGELSDQYYLCLNSMDDGQCSREDLFEIERKIGEINDAFGSFLQIGTPIHAELNEIAAVLEKKW